MPAVYIITPFCKLEIIQKNNTLHHIDFVNQSKVAQTTRNHLLIETLKQIRQYLKNADFLFDLPINPQGTEFQRRVWTSLQQIPAGEVITYGELARELNSSPRAIGNACRKNPIPLIIPCHRVISAQGIGGFAGQTQGQKITIKKQLLQHEGIKI